LGTLWLGTDNNGSVHGVWRSTDCGANWTHVNTGMNGSAVDGAAIWSMALDHKTPGIIYVIGAYGPMGIWKSTNFGVDWVQLTPAGSNVAKAIPAGSNAWIGSITMDPNDPMHLIAGAHATCAAGYYPLCQAETKDGGKTWSVANVHVPGVTQWIEQAGPWALDETSSLYSILGNGGLWLTRDNGANWTNVTPPEITGGAGGEYTDRPLRRSPLGYYYLPAVGGQGGLIRSKDGYSWSHIPNSPNGSYELGFAMGGGNLYLGDLNSFDVEVANESTPSVWKRLPPLPISPKLHGPAAMEYDEAHGILYAACLSGGVWRMATP
jgi:hypothetical protein